MATVLLLLVPVPDVRAGDPASLPVRQIVAHRGSSADRPENTMVSIRRAIEAGATAVEVDVRLTEDGAAVLMHDARLERTTSGRGRVADKTLAEIQRLDAGSWFDPRFAGERVPTLEQALAACGNKVDVLLDLKESGDDYERKVVAVVQAHGDPGRVILGVRSVDQARRLRRLLPQSRQLGFIDNPDDVEAFAAEGVETIRLRPEWLTDDELLLRVRKAGVGLHINEDSGSADEVAELLEYRPDSLLTDDPARLIATLTTMAR